MDAEAMYGLSLHVRRIRSFVGSQFFKVMFYNNVLGFHIDEEIIEGLETPGRSREEILSWYESNYKRSLLWRASRT